MKEKSLIRVTRNADIDTEMIYDEDLDYRDAMENLIKERKRMNPVRMEFTGTLNKKNDACVMQNDPRGKGTCI